METVKRAIEDTKRDLSAWWDGGDQEHPCLIASCRKTEPAEIPDTDDLEAYWSDVDFRIAHTMAAIEATEYYGDAVPFHSVGYGASTMAGVLGARMECVDKETVWAYPVFNTVEEVLDSDLKAIWRSTPYWKSLVSCTEKSANRALNHHYVDVFPLAGAMDNLAALYGTENLMMDLLQKPDLVKRAMNILKEIWIEAFDDMSEIIATSGNKGNIGWAGIWAPGTTFPMQEDISYMISSDMYRDFCLPHIVDCVHAMDYPFYHLDGIPALSHLDALLEISELRVIQWVPGAGHEEIAQWYDVLKKIIAGGKSCQAFARAAEIPDLVKNVGSKGLLITCSDAGHQSAQDLAINWGKV